MSGSCECCVLSGTGLCVGLITSPEESYRMCGVSVIPGLLRHEKKNVSASGLGWLDTADGERVDVN